MKFHIKYLLGFLLIILTACQLKTKREKVLSDDINTLSVNEKNEGWKLLFDGETFNGWRGLGRDNVQTELWTIVNGEIKKIDTGEVPSRPDGQPVQGGDLMTIDTFLNFELYFEWKVLKAGNSGLKYNVSEQMSQKYASKHSALGFEYQMLDDLDSTYIGKLKLSQYSGSLYDMIVPDNPKLKPAGTYNSSRIIINGNQVKHWLNGKIIVEFEFESERLDSLYRNSKYRNFPDFHKKRKGHIVLQNHKDEAWFRNIKIREIK